MNVNMQDTDFQNLKEISWRRPLTAVELARLRQLLAARPELRAQWDQEAALDRLLYQLPAARVSSNFTARVVWAAQQAPARPGWMRWLPGLPPVIAPWLPRCALGAAIVCVGFLGFRGYQLTAQRAQAARDLASVSRLAALPPMDWLKDYEVINRLNKVKVADDDLLAVLQ
jgi:anti-sigma factor RsiW